MIASKDDLRRYLGADLAAHGLGEWRWSHRFRHSELYFQRRLRKLEYTENCRIHSDVNIGEAGGRAPRIGDNVYIAPGAKIFGGITVGDNAAIGANAVVNTDVPAGVTVAGVPARVVSERGSEGLVLPAVD